MLKKPRAFSTALKEIKLEQVWKLPPCWPALTVLKGDEQAAEGELPSTIRHSVKVPLTGHGDPTGSIGESQLWG